MYAYVHLPLTLTLTLTLPATYKPVSVWLYEFCIYFAYFFVHCILGKKNSYGMDEITATQLIKSDGAKEGRLFIEKVVSDIISKTKTSESISRDVYMKIEQGYKPILTALSYLERNDNMIRCYKLIKHHCQIHVIYIYIYCIYINGYIYIYVYITSYSVK